MTIPVITTTITPPLVTDSLAEFNNKAFAAWVDLSSLGPEINAATAGVSAAVLAVNDDVEASTQQVSLAIAQVELAAEQVVLTVLDAAATAQDRVQTGLDRTATGLSAADSETSHIAASKLNLGNKSSAPTVDNQGDTLLAGATYYDTTLAKWRVRTASNAWGDGLSAVAGVSSINGLTGDVLLASTSLSGETVIYVSQVITYTITDFDSFSTYAVGVSAGSVTRSGATISVTAPGASGNITLTVTTNGTARAIVLTVQAAGVAAPSITSPTNAATGVTGPSMTLTSSAFAWLGVSDTHLNSDWQLATDAAFTSIVQSASASTTSKTSWTTTVTSGTTYYARVRHRGTANGVSAYSATVTFSTAASFNSYIATPTATPASFGEAFEGGFYMGLFWNQIAQAANSKTLATGTQTFTVADMTSTPLVYAGHVLEVRSRANPDNKFIGTVTGALGTTLTLSVSSITGGGTFSDWSVMSRFRSIEAPKSSGENAGITLKNANTAFPAACQTLTEGWEATLAMVAADSATVYPAAHWARSLVIGGRSDWHLPARDVRELAWRNGKPTTDANYVSADRPTAQTFDYKNAGSYGDTANTHGLNKNSSPAGAAYTSSVPSQAVAAAFRTGGSEAFEYGSVYYWSCSEYSATGAWYQHWYSSIPGNQSNYSKTSAYRVRAVRRSII